MWIVECGLVIFEVLLVLLYIGGEDLFGILWIVVEDVGYFY